VYTLNKALCSDKDQFGVLIASEHRYIGEAHDILGHSNKARDLKTTQTDPVTVGRFDKLSKYIFCRSLIKALKHFNIFVEKEDSKNNNYLEQAVRYGLF